MPRFRAIVALVAAAVSREGTAKAVRGAIAQRHLSHDAPGPILPTPFMAQHCQNLAEAIAMSPAPTCKYVALPAGYASCSCQVAMPLHVNTKLGAIAGEPDQQDVALGIVTTNAPLGKAMTTGAPLQPVLVAPSKPECPFAASCGADKLNCVGYDSFGFNQVIRAEVTKEALLLNTINCDYVMQPQGMFSLPIRAASFANVQKNLRDVAIDVECGHPEGIHIKKDDSFLAFCRYALYQLKASCSASWATALGGGCKGVAAPDGFTTASLVQDLCPIECGQNVLDVAAQLEQVSS